MKCIAVINQKGGVGKTTTTANLGAGLARFGKRVLLLDLDPQANLTLHLDCRLGPEEITMTHLLADDHALAPLIRPTTEEGLFIVPADTSLGGVEQALANRIGRETILREALDAYDSSEKFDYVLMDCPPSLGVLSANALVSADQVLIPMQTEYFSLQGMAKLTEVIGLVQRRLNPDLGILFVLPCMVDLRTRLTSEVLSEIEIHFGSLVARTRIRPNVKLAEAPSFGLTIFEHAEDSNGAEDYGDLAREVLERHGVVDFPEFRGFVFEQDEDFEDSEDESEEAEVPTDSQVEETPAVEAPTEPSIPTPPPIPEPAPAVQPQPQFAPQPQVAPQPESGHQVPPPPAPMQQPAPPMEEGA